MACMFISMYCVLYCVLYCVNVNICAYCNGNVYWNDLVPQFLDGDILIATVKLILQFKFRLDEILAKIYERSKIDMYRSMCIGDLGNKASSYNSLDPAENVRRDRTNLLKANTIRNKTTIQFSQSMKRSKGSNLVYATNLLKLKRTKSDNKNGVGYGTGYDVDSF